MSGPNYTPDDDWMSAYEGLVYTVTILAASAVVSIVSRKALAFIKKKIRRRLWLRKIAKKGGSKRSKR